MATEKKGWKTWVGGIGAMLSGIGLIAGAIYTGNISMDVAIEGLSIFTGGLLILGVGHKVQKLIDAVKDQKK